MPFVERLRRFRPGGPAEISRGWSNAEPPGPAPYPFRPGGAGERRARTRPRSQLIPAPPPGRSAGSGLVRRFRSFPAPPPANLRRPSGPKNSPPLRPGGPAEISRGWSNAKPPGTAPDPLRPGGAGERRARTRPRSRQIPAPPPGRSAGSGLVRWFRSFPSPPPVNFCRASGPKSALPHFKQSLPPENRAKVR